MAETEEKSSSMPWLPLLALVAAGSGILYFFPQLNSSRPGGGDSRLAGNTFGVQTINARLWEDPLAVAMADREKKESGTESKKENDAHSVGRFQTLLIEKCFAEPPIYPLLRPTIYPIEDEVRFSGKAQRVQILAVMIPGGPYVEDTERRLRARRAVIEGLVIAGYYPEKDDEIGYFRLPWQPLEPSIAACVSKLEKSRNEDERRYFPIKQEIRPARIDGEEPEAYRLLVPYEWCEKAGSITDRQPPMRILVLWLTDDAFRDAPLARLADLISWFRLRLSSAVEGGCFLPLPVSTVLGPDNSGTLRMMVMEAEDNVWSDEKRQYLAKTHIYSSQATAAEPQLLSEIRPRIPFERGGDTCESLIEQSVRGPAAVNDFRFDRTIAPDDRVVETMWGELKARGIEAYDQIAVVSEEDTYDARALRSTFDSFSLCKVQYYTYLRGIDGKLPSETKDNKEAKNSPANDDNNTQSSSRPTERREGLDQADYARRLAENLGYWDIRLRANGGRGLKAICLLGSDVYDKLELLKALRPLFPGSVFLTNNLDARLAHPEEWNEARNLVVVSAYGLSLGNTYQGPQRVAPFRDGMQTSLFEATLKAMGHIQAGNGGISRSPLIFEIEGKGIYRLSTAVDRPQNIELIPYYLALPWLIVWVSFFLVWIYLVSRVTLNPSEREIANMRQ